LNGSGLLSKTVKGNLEGSSIPGVFIPRLITFWQDGRFPFDRLTSKTYSLEQINDSVAGMESGEVIKPLILY
jgi:aryl-alcohol dehydrogenase